MNYSEIQKAKERALGKIGATSNTNISNKFNTETIKKAKETALNKIQSKDNKTGLVGSEMCIRDRNK